MCKTKGLDPSGPPGVRTGRALVLHSGEEPGPLPGNGGAGEAERGVAAIGVPGAVGSGVLVGSAMVYVCASMSDLGERAALKLYE
jgi:hypothetical protein